MVNNKNSDVTMTTVHVEHVKPLSSSSRKSNSSNERNDSSMKRWSTRDLSRPNSSSINTTTTTSNNKIDGSSSHSSSQSKKSQTGQVAGTSSHSSSSKNYQERMAEYNDNYHSGKMRSSTHSSPYQREKKYDSNSNRDESTGNVAVSRSIRTGAATDDDDDDNDHINGNDTDDAVVQILALQMYHMPGNSWCGDWCMFMKNNHPVFGICCHNKLHPIGSCQRIIALIGTILFGLTLTSMFYLFYLWNPQFDQTVAEIVTPDGEVWTLTTGMLLLWTVGSSIHCIFNLVIWHIAACVCCQRGGCCERYACCPSLGKHVSRVLIVCILALTVMIVLLRVAIANAENNQTLTTDAAAEDKNVNIGIDDGLVLDVQNASEFQFVAAYLVEMVLSLFVYHPLGGTVLFSGMLACGFQIPLLGGRPYEVAMEERRNNNKRNSSSIYR